MSSAVTANARRASRLAAKRRAKQVVPSRRRPAGPARNPLRLDPSRTGALRVKAGAAVRARYDRLRTALYRFVVLEDALGLADPPDWFVGNTGLCPVANEAAAQPRDARGRWARVGGSALAALGRAGAKAEHLEAAVTAYVRDNLEAGVSRLPAQLQGPVRATVHAGKVLGRAAFVTWTAGEALAERTARERGMSEDGARRLRGVLSALDVATFKPVSVALLSSGVGTAAVGALSFVPPASAAYLAYSTARDPAATWRAAKGLARDTWARVRGRPTANDLAWNVDGAGGNCGTGAGGFKPGNTCATGGGGVKGVPRRPDGLPDPETKEGIRCIARALRQSMWKASKGSPKDWCNDTATALRSVYTDAEEWHGGYGGNYDEQAHTIVKLAGVYVDVTADQFGGKKVVVRRKLAGEYADFEKGRAPAPTNLSPKSAASAVAEEFRKRLAPGYAANAAADVARDLADYLAAHPGDWPFAVLLACVEEAGNARQGVLLAAECLRANPLMNDGRTDYPEDGQTAGVDNALGGLVAFGERLRRAAVELWRGLEETINGLVELAVRKGAGRSFDEVRAGHFLDPNFRPAARDQFLRGVFGDRDNRDRFDALKKRGADEVANHRDSVVEKVERVVNDGVLKEQTPSALWKEITTVIDRERDSAVTTVTDEVVRGHAEGQVAGFGGAGVTELFPLLEWTVHPDASKTGVCPRCAALKGTVWTVSDARGKIPLHRNCRCSWTARNQESLPNRRPSPAPTHYAPGAGAKFRTNAESGGANCGTGAGGFKPGNTCARGGGVGKVGGVAGGGPSDPEWVRKKLGYSEPPFLTDTNPPYTPGDLTPARKAAAPVLDVPVADLIATQSGLNAAYVRQLAAGGPVRPGAGEVLVAKVGDKLYLDDGTHRAAGALLRGDATVRARVVDMTPALAPVGPHGLSPAAEEYRRTAWHNGGGGRKSAHDLPEPKLRKLVRSYAAQVSAADRAGRHDVARELAEAAPRIFPRTRTLSAAGAVEPYDGGRHEGALAGHRGDVRVVRPGVEYDYPPRRGLLGGGAGWAAVIRARAEVVVTANRKSTGGGNCGTGSGGFRRGNTCAVRGGKPGNATDADPVATEEEFAASWKLAKSKVKTAPTPGPEKVAKMREALRLAREGKGRAGGDARGSSKDRRARALNLFREFGGDEKGYVVCPWTGIKMHWADPSDKVNNPRGYPKFEQGKIFTACQGGGYQLPNLLPESFAANRSRNDKRLRKENARGC